MTQQEIAKVVKEAVKESGGVRKVAAMIEMEHPQIVRVTKGSNVNVKTLLRILDGIGLEIQIVRKGE